jgi:hypothetical protein
LKETLLKTFLGIFSQNYKRADDFLTDSNDLDQGIAITAAKEMDLKKNC